MSSIEHVSEEQSAVRNDLSAIFVSLELSRSTWLVTSVAPGGGEKMSKHQVRSGDIAGLLEKVLPTTGEEQGAYRAVVPSDRDP